MATLRIYQARTMFLLSFGYFFYCIARKALSVSMPLLLQKNDSGISLLNESDIGTISSSFAAAYGLSKFVGALLSDVFSCSTLLAMGLFLAAFCNIIFPFSLYLPLSTSLTLSFIWGVNGLVQGVGWPALSAILMSWFPPSQSGTMWSIGTSAGSIGTAVAGPFLLYFANKQWENSFVAAGVSSLLMSFLLFLFLYDTPKQMNLISPWIKDRVKEKVKEKESEKKDNNPSSSISAFYSVVIFRLSFWIIMIGDLFIYFILRLCSEWLILMLIRHNDYSVAMGSTSMFFYETGGVVGTLLSGPLSDYLHGRRNLTSFIYLILLSFSLFLLWTIKMDTWSVNLLVFTIGFAGNGPKTLAGISVRESHVESAGTAGGALGMAGQVGAALAGYPIGLLIKTSSSNTQMWDGCLLLLLSSSLLSTFLFGLLSVFDYNQVKEGGEKEKKD